MRGWTEAWEQVKSGDRWKTAQVLGAFFDTLGWQSRNGIATDVGQTGVCSTWNTSILDLRSEVLHVEQTATTQKGLAGVGKQAAFKPEK